MNTESPHFWQGMFIDDDEALRRLAEDLPKLVERATAVVMNTETVLDACDRLSVTLLNGGDTRRRLLERLCSYGMEKGEADGVLTEIGEFLHRENLETKLCRELGDVTAHRLRRPDSRATVYEAWAPVGLLVHIAPGNAAAVAPLSVVEGLLAGNVNVLKTSSDDSLLPQLLLAELAAMDPTGAIAARTVVLRFSSRRQDWLRLMCAHADAVAVWGGEAAVAGIAEHVPAGCRFIVWGHKISFAYLPAGCWSDPGVVAALAADVCLLDQQACSSPQVVYLDTADHGELFAFADRLAGALAEETTGLALLEPDLAEQAEISATELIARLEEHLDLTKVLTATDGSWRVIADVRPALTASPLYRTVWVKPLPRADLITTLQPMRRYLQTAGVTGTRADVAELSRMLFAAGVTRVTPIGGMLDGYCGEPHDGVYALQRYSRRVSVRAAGEQFASIACLDDLVASRETPPVGQGPLSNKKIVQAGIHRVRPEHAQMYFRSGGTTGKPALSVFTYHDYDLQMRAAAEGLVAAGFDPRVDRVANLFYGGQMYGSFISFFSILERLRAVQIPMAAGSDYVGIAEALVEYQVNTVLGMPSFLWKLFTEQDTILRSYGGIRKVFYGGEHFSPAQARRLTQDFGVELVRSATYGSTDLGPLGYQCEYCEGTVHHLHDSLHSLEILDVDAERPVVAGEVGRLVVSSHTRRGQDLRRYEIGDLGRAVSGVCPCGRAAPRFELLGRHGDVMRLGTIFVNYRRLERIAEEKLGYCGELQVLCDGAPDRERLFIRMDENALSEPENARAVFIGNYPDLASSVQDRLLDFAVQPIAAHEFLRAAGTGKLRQVVDLRSIRGSANL